MKKYRVKVAYNNNINREYIDMTLEELTQFFAEAELGMLFEVFIIEG